MEDLYLKGHRKFMELGWRIIRKSRRNLANLGFAWNQYTIMKKIQPGEHLTLSEISEGANKKNSNVTPIIDFLVEKGIVERIPDTKDRRVVRVGLTKEGVGIRENIIISHENFIKQLYKEVQPKELEDFINIIEIFLEKI